MPVQITINGGDAAEAIREFKSLSSAFTGPAAAQLAAASEAPQTQDVTPQAPIQPAPTQQASYPQTGQTAPQGQPFQQPPQYGQAGTAPYQPPQPPAPSTQAPVAGSVPTSAPTYTLDQLGVAVQPLMDAGHQDKLIGWLHQNGAGALTQLNPSKYGEFATFLRSLGARI